MASSGAAGYALKVHHPEVMRSILEQIVETGDVIGTAGPDRTIIAVTGVGPAQGDRAGADARRRADRGRHAGVGGAHGAQARSQAEFRE